MDRSSGDSSGSEGGNVMSKRERRKEEMQRKQQRNTLAELTEGSPPARTTIPEDSSTAADNPTDCAQDGWAHDRQPPMTGPCVVEYCPTCGMPFEYCEFSGAACAKQAEEQDLSNQSATTQQQEDEKQLSLELQEKASISSAKGGGGKKEGAKPKVVTVQKQAKRRGKCATNVWGLEHFGVKQEQAAKLASKHFACGSSFQKGQPGQAPFIEIQGDVEGTIAAFFLKNFNIPEDKIVFLAEK